MKIDELLAELDAKDSQKFEKEINQLQFIIKQKDE
jgi:hypothetical protein